jgi:hypothetical protein
MDESRIIHAPKGATYISEIKNFKIPANCLFNKGKTGCGGTETAINQDGHTIIAVPFVNLAKNKEITNERRKYDVLAVHGDVDKDAVTDFANLHETLKIIVVYDSLPRLIYILTALGYDVFRDFSLLVDEYHILFNQYSFRPKPIKELLRIAPNFRQVTYMSATPIEREFILEELKHLPTVVMK